MDRLCGKKYIMGLEFGPNAAGQMSKAKYQRIKYQWILFLQENSVQWVYAERSDATNYAQGKDHVFVPNIMII